MSDFISLRCPGCRARLRAARALLNRACPCPRRRRPVLVRPPPPGDSGVALVPDDARGAAPA
jgi:hypothetical protein